MGILDDVVWEVVDRVESPEGLPVVTHEGMLEIFDHKLRCYRLDDGRAIINAEDFHELFGDLGIEPASEIPVTAMSATAS